MAGKQLVTGPPENDKPHRYLYDNHKRHDIHIVIQKILNTKGSIETDLVAVDTAMGQVPWTRYFVAAQRQHVISATIYRQKTKVSSYKR